MCSSPSLVNDDQPHTNSVIHKSKIEGTSEGDPLQILKSTKLKNYNRLVVGQININGLKNKFESLQMLIKGNIGNCVITETKIDESFPSLQFAIEGYAPPFRLDRNVNGGGVIIYVREDIP